MTQKERLLHALFDGDKSKEHRNIKFFRGSGPDISPEGICGEANRALFEANLGLVEAHPEFGDRNSPSVDVKHLP